ncbi:hypothetical protein ACHHYP_13043 [Achlya hypogyna]|uniref:M96 mating-specific protein family n=1 Tax=Achlya hypogyna TaxID=1202772 RepID=A0A1V9YGB9_ACHHY|nr:hypothetical protein ACHHYP_13043 [Achlya hypogyna]
MNILDLLPPPTDDILGFLDDTPSSEGSATLDSSPTMRAKRRKRVQPKAVLDNLRDEHVRLKAELARLKEVAALKIQGLSPDDAMWERVAMAQKALKLKAQRENDELRGWVAEQAEYREYLEKTLLKQPRGISMLMDKLTDERWRSLALGPDGPARIAAIHAIADRQHDMVESEMVQKGLFSPAEDIMVVRRAPKIGSVEGMRYTVLRANMAHIPDVAMEVLRHRQVILEREAATSGAGPVVAMVSVKQVHVVDPDTLYSREMLTHPNGKLKVTSSMIIKKYICKATGRVCIVWRSVLDDEGWPHATDSFVNDEYGWLHFEPKDNNHVNYKVYLCSSPPVTPASSALDHLNELVQMVDLSERDIAPPPTDGMTNFVETVRSAFTRASSLFEREIQLMEQ